MSEQPTLSAIRCVTANPAMDITYTLDELTPGRTHRTTSVAQRAGGKGVNVARILHHLGHQVHAIGPTGGIRGDEIEADLAASGLPHETTRITGDSRRTVTLVADDQATLINEPGPVLDAAEWNALSTTVTDDLARTSVLVLSGSLPRGVSDNGYAELIASAAARHVPTILDTSGSALRLGVTAGPTVVKPNAEELLELTGQSDPLAGAVALRKIAEVSVVVSLGADGLLAVTDDGAWRVVTPRTLPGNPTGAGDAVVAALAAGVAGATAWPHRLADAVALAMATVAADLAGDVNLSTYRQYTGAIRAEEIHAAGIHR